MKSVRVWAGMRRARPRYDYLRPLLSTRPPRPDPVHPRHFPAARACPTPSAPTPASSSPSPRRPYIRPCRCRKLHESTDALIGTPLNPATYDYEGAVLFNAHASTLWARFTTYLRREIAAGLAGCVTGSPHCWPWWSAR